MEKKVIVIAGPTGSGKDSVIKGVISRCSNVNFFVNATTRKPRVDEVHGQNYYFLDNPTFLKEIEAGNILEYYHRTETDTYYGTYKPDVLKKIEGDGIGITQIQIVGAKKLKEMFDATTIFILPESNEILEQRVRSRSEMSDTEWQERLAHLKREIEEDLPFYDYQIYNKQGELEKTVDDVMLILEKEGYKLNKVN
jgi:guanylate kinase